MLAVMEQQQFTASARLPLAFTPVDVYTLGFTSSQVAEVENLRQAFMDQVETKNVADPVYKKRWIRAQMELDDLLRTRIGWEAYNRYQQAAAQVR